jgi:hypothetical protein
MTFDSLMIVQRIACEKQSGAALAKGRPAFFFSRVRSRSNS